MCGGYCFLNNAAIAAQYLLTHGDLPRMAILDIDIHHGNGTQQIFYERGDMLVISLHGDPAWFYPYFLGYADEQGAGAGLGANLNIPLPNGTDDATYFMALENALGVIRAFAPGALVVSTGLDTFGDDPVDAAIGFLLTHAAYPEIGRRIGTLNLPTLFIQEGGYAVSALGENLVALLHGFEGQSN
jgi:acetoin utilization deacetylase AcuC-like enzyme